MDKRIRDALTTASTVALALVASGIALLRCFFVRARSAMPHSATDDHS
jgi:hypothetical protein